MYLVEAYQCVVGPVPTVIETEGLVFACIMTGALFGFLLSWGFSREKYTNEENITLEEYKNG